MVHDLGYHIAGGADVGGQVLLASGTGDVSKSGQSEAGRPFPLEHAYVGEEAALDHLWGPVDRRI